MKKILREAARLGVRSDDDLYRCTAEPSQGSGIGLFGAAMLWVVSWEEVTSAYVHANVSILSTVINFRVAQRETQLVKAEKTKDSRTTLLADSPTIEFPRFIKVARHRV